PLGVRTRSVSTAAAGLEQAHPRDPNERPSLIFLDINLPDRPGWSVLAALKSDKVTASIPVVVVSVEPHWRTSSELGAAEHLVKPVPPELIAATVMRLGIRRADSEPAEQPTQLYG